METALNLEQLAVDLENAARGARARMPKRELSPFSDPAQHRRWLHTFLREMATVIDQTAPSNGAGRSRQLYLWPGYDSILLDGMRVTFEVDTDVRRNLAQYGYPSGITADGNDRIMQTGALFPPPEKRLTDRATLYFDAALAGIEPARAGAASTFSVGGTHNWLALGPTVQGDTLLGLEVRTRPGAVSAHRSFPAISLDTERPLQWGDELAAAINGVCGDTPESFWPLPVRRGGETHATYRTRLAAEHAAARHRSIRHRLYSLWLIGCFLADPAAVLLDRSGSNWLDRLISELEQVEPERAARIRGLRELERNLASGAKLELDPARFTTWSVVTIPYAIADTRSGDSGDEPDDLGSGMLLSNFNLPSTYYLVVRQWIASYYLSLRQQESAVLRAEREAHKAAISAERELRKQLSHAVGTELTYVSFLAKLAAEAIGEDQFVPRAAVLRGGVIEAGRDFDARLSASEFAAKYGAPTPLEEGVIELLVKGASVLGGLERDISLVQSSLKAIPSEDARYFLGALEAEVIRVSHENRALVRVDDISVVASFEQGGSVSGDPHAQRLVDLLARAFIVALTVFFRKAFPPGGENSELICLAAAEALFGISEDDDEVARREVAQATSWDWREFIDGCYRNTGKLPDYRALLEWMTNTFSSRSVLRLVLPSPENEDHLAAGCGEYAPLIIEAWLTEAILNALKHSRPGTDGAAVFTIEWLNGNALLEVSNTTTAESAQNVVSGAGPVARGVESVVAGHQGLAFLRYAARNLFEGKKLHAGFHAPSSRVRLFIA